MERELDAQGHAAYDVSVIELNGDKLVSAECMLRLP